MNWWRRVSRRWVLEDALDAELRYHFDRLVEDGIAAGLSPRAARRRAREEFGGLEEIKDACRDARGTRWVHDFAADLRFSARMLARERAFTFAAVLALALGIGVNTTLFTIMNAICLRGLPIDEPDRVVDIAARNDAGRPQPLSPAQFDAIRTAHAAALAGAAAYTTRPATLRDPGVAAERITLASMSAGAFSLIRQQPLLGRDFRADEDTPGGERVLLLGAELWRTRYASDPGVVGRSVIVDGSAATVIGVMPDGFRFPDAADAWQLLSHAMTMPQDAAALTVFARLADESSVAQAQAIVSGILSDPDRHLTSAPGTAVSVTPINTRYRGSITDPAWLAFLTAGGLVVVIACSNVANLLLARGVRRARELTVRLSLGATRGRIVRQLLTETSMLAGLGGLAGLAVAAGALRLFTAAIPSNGLPYWIIFTMDARVFAALAAVCLGAVLLSGLAPAVQLARTNVMTSLKETSASVSGSLGARRWTWVFLTAQLGFTVILLSAVGMTVQGFYALQRRGPTIDAAHLLTFGITLPPDGYRTPAQRDAFFRTLDDRLTGSPGVLAMSRASTLPANLGQPRRLIVAGQTTASAPVVRATSIDEHYFRTLGLSLVAGRPFDRTDLVDARPVAVVNQRFAEMFLPDGSAVGHTIRLAGFDARAGDAGEARTVVGIAPSVHRQPTVEHEPVIYLPMAAAGTANASWLLRTDGDPRALVPLVREEVRRLDANVPVHSVATLEEANWQARWNARVSFGLIFAIAFVALALATIGLAAMTAQAVTQRTRELGIRLALGAAGSHVVALVLRRVALQIAVGLLVGAIGAHAWGRVFATPGFATAGNLTAVALLVIAVTMGVAAAIARRAARIDPLSALRYE